MRWRREGMFQSFYRATTTRMGLSPSTSPVQSVFFFVFVLVFMMLQLFPHIPRWVDCFVEQIDDEVYSFWSPSEDNGFHLFFCAIFKSLAAGK